MNPILKKFTTNKSIVENIMKNINCEEILNNPYVLIEYISLEDIEKVISCDDDFDKNLLRNNRIRAYIFEYIKRPLHSKSYINIPINSLKQALLQHYLGKITTIYKVEIWHLKIQTIHFQT